MILGNYEIIRQIGEGGFGRTYEARHVLLKNVKSCLKQNINLSPADAQLLMHEAEVMAGVNHVSLPAWRDFYKIEDGSYVLAMSFEEGKSLDKTVEKHKAIHPEDVCWMTQRLLNALYVLHGKGIIHGDVKPPNIIVRPQEHNAILVDYGLSSIRPTKASKAVGYTAIFAAPEIIAGKPPVPESDIYSLGLTMIYALGGDPVAKTIPDHVPKQVQQFCNDLVRYNPVDRPRWETQDLVARLSDVRQEAFGRRISKT